MTNSEPISYYSYLQNITQQAKRHLTIIEDAIADKVITDSELDQITESFGLLMGNVKGMQAYLQAEKQRRLGDLRSAEVAASNA